MSSILKPISLRRDAFTPGPVGDKLFGEVYNALALLNTKLTQDINSNASLDFEAKNLKFDVISTTEVLMTADSIKFVSNEGLCVVKYDISETFSMDDHIQGPELASTWYEAHIDSDLNLKLVPNLTGTCNGTVT